MTTPATPKLPEPATGAMKVVAWWVEAIGLGQREKPHPSYNPEPLVRLSDAQALAGEVERLRAEVAPLGKEACNVGYAHFSPFYLLANARNLTSREMQRQPNWVLAKKLFAVGSTTANRICREAGIDPDAFEVRKVALDASRAVATQEAKA